MNRGGYVTRRRHRVGTIEHASRNEEAEAIREQRGWWAPKPPRNWRGEWPPRTPGEIERALEMLRAEGRLT